MQAFTPDIKVTDLLKKHIFTLSAEVIPPRNGAAQAVIMDQIDALLTSGAQFLSVTKGAGGSLRGGSLPIAQVVKERFQSPSIAHFTCRDITPEEVENQLMDHHYFGIRNILALRGDPPMGSDWAAKEGSYNFAYELIDQIKKLNEGVYLERKGFKSKSKEATDFCIGAAVYPDHPNEVERFEFYRRKVEAGAEFGITQMVFSADSLHQFLEKSKKMGLELPILAGTRIMKSKEQAMRMAERFQVPFPQSYLNKLPSEKDQWPLDALVEPFLSFVDELKSAGAQGIHLFVLSDTDISTAALKVLRAQLTH